MRQNLRTRQESCATRITPLVEYVSCLADAPSRLCDPLRPVYVRTLKSLPRLTSSTRIPQAPWTDTNYTICNNSPLLHNIRPPRNNKMISAEACLKACRCTFTSEALRTRLGGCATRDCPWFQPTDAPRKLCDPPSDRAVVCKVPRGRAFKAVRPAPRHRSSV